MFLFKLALIAASVVLSTSSPTNPEASCTISSFSDVNKVVSSCTSIVIQNLKVPGGKTLDLNLKSGTKLTFKGTTTFGTGTHWLGPLIHIKGNKLTVTGEGGSKLDGQGSHYWDGKGDSGPQKPKFFRIQATGGSTFSNINLLNCPHQCVSIQDSSQLTLSGWTVDVSAGDKNSLGHNTDGFDVSSSDSVTIKNSVVKNQDDCICVNSGKNYHFSNIQCSGGHGISLSVGVNKNDYSKNQVTNVTFSDCTIKNSRNGIHVKTHCDGGSGLISGVTYSNIKLSGITNYGICIQQDYQGGGGSGHPTSNIPIKGLTLKQVTGSMSSSKAVPVYILCGSNACSNYQWSGVSISGGGKNSCNYKPSGFKC